MIPPFVDASWLAEHPGAVVADVRCVTGRPDPQGFTEGHVPGAVFLDLDSVLAAPPSTAQGRHPLPTPDQFAAGLSAAGIGDGDQVIAHDTDSGAIAARLVWLLRLLGVDAALLDGHLELSETGASARPPAVFTPRAWPLEAFVGIADVQAGPAALLDARPAGRFAGVGETLDLRAGHVPGARSVPCRDNVGSDGRLLPDEELYRRLGDLPDGWVSSCGSGVTACHTLLVAERLGLPPGRLWTGSWSQWSATDLPIALGQG